MSAPVLPHATERWTPRQRLTLALLLTASFTLAVDFSILNVALPRIGEEIGLEKAHLQWVVTSFALCAAGFTLLFGRLADLVGRKRLFLLGMAVLGVGSLIGGLAQEPVLLIVARVLQGLATAAVTPAALALLTTSFPEGPQRDKALGLNGSLMAAGFTAGAILGGILTDLVSWRWAFLLNVPVAVLVLALAPGLLKENNGPRQRLDGLGAVLVTASLLALVFGMTNAGEHGFGSVSAWLPLVVGVVLLVVFFAVEQRVASPLVPLPVVRRRAVAWGNVVGILAFATETSLVFVLTLYLQGALGFTPLQAGLTFAVLGVGTVLGGLIAPKVVGALGLRVAVAGAMVVQAAATAALLFMGHDAAVLGLILAATFVGGVANLVAIVGFMIRATGGIPAEDQGLATGVANMSTQVGITLGTPIMAAVLAPWLLLGGAVNLVAGVHVAIAVNAGLCLLTAVLAVLFLGVKGGDAAVTDSDAAVVAGA